MKLNCHYRCLYHLFFWLFKRIDLLADKYGRKHVLMICLSITIFAGIMESLSVNFWMYLFFQTLGSLGQAGCFQTGFILALETVGKSHRYVLFWTGPNYFSPLNFAFIYVEGHKSLTAVFCPLYFYRFEQNLDQKKIWVWSK